MDPAEREEVFFRYENSFLVKQSGYYLYYEKNPQMQAYMLEKNAGKEQRQEEVPDEAVKAFRKIIQKKKNNIEEKETEELEERTSVFSYAATACLVFAVALAGTKFYQHYQEIQVQYSLTEAVSAVMEAKQQGIGDDETADKIEAIKKEETANGYQNDNTQKSDSRKSAEQKKENLESDGLKTENENEGLRGEGKQNEKSGQESGVEREKQEKHTESIYKQESDIRKAGKRVREQQKGMESKSEETSGNSGSYIIRPGDTLYQISIQNYGNMDAVEEICRLNGITADEIIYPGQIIVLP